MPKMNCKYCNINDANFENKKIFANHVRWCKDRPVQNTENISNGIRKHYDEKLGERTAFQVTCSYCKNNFSVIEYKKLFPQRDKYFCSRGCANSRGPRTEEVKKKISDSINEYNKKNNKQRTIVYNGDYSEKKKYYNRKNKDHKICPLCKDVFFKKTKFCTNKCRISSLKKESMDLARYRLQCQFKFNLSSFEEEFDFSIIKEYGWYSPSNHGGNLSGVSRDHIVSVRFGFDNDIDPNIISHPANCRLIRQSDNASKGKKCEISLEELLEKIKNWNIKYGEYK